MARQHLVHWHSLGGSAGECLSGITRMLVALAQEFPGGSVCLSEANCRFDSLQSYNFAQRNARASEGGFVVLVVLVFLHLLSRALSLLHEAPIRSDGGCERQVQLTFRQPAHGSLKPRNQASFEPIFAPSLPLESVTSFVATSAPIGRLTCWRRRFR